MRELVLLIAILHFPYEAWSQHSDSLICKGDYIGVETGFGYFRVKDAIESPLTYHKSFLPVQLFYRHNSYKNVQEINFLFFNNVLESSISSESYLTSKHICISLSYSYLRNTNLKLLNKSSFSVGGTFVNFISYRKHNYELSVEENADLFSQISIKCELIKRLNVNTELSWDCSLPLLGYVTLRRRNLHAPMDGITSMPVTYGDILKTGDFLTINRFIDFHSRIRYKKKLGNRLSFCLTYLFRFYHYFRYEHDLPVNAGINSLNIGFKFRL